MLIWVILAALSAAVVAIVVRPLSSGLADGVNARDADIAVYRDQLAEIDADRARGLIADDDAIAARAEVARRLLARSQGAVVAGPATGASRRTRIIAMATAAAIPIVSIAVYAALGSPTLPARPHAARAAVPPSTAGIEDLISRVEARLREHPEDGAGWDVIAPVYLSQQRYADAAEAFARAIRLVGETPARLAGLAEALVIANNGMVGDAARSAYERLMVLEPQRPEPRFWLALAKEQDGKLEAAAAEYRALLANAPTGASWTGLVAERLSEVEAKLGRKPAAGAIPGAGASARPPPASQASDGKSGAAGDVTRGRGPSPEDVTAAASLSPADRAAFIKQMVSGLAERLDRDGRDLEGWEKLVRAYKVMGQDSDAVAALARARKALEGDTAAQGALTDLARTLGLGS